VTYILVVGKGLTGWVNGVAERGRDLSLIMEIIQPLIESAKES
jgi:hypothetical protein